MTPETELPLFATYISSCEEIAPLLDAGFEYLIIDLPELSLAARGSYNPQSDFALLGELTAAIRAEDAEVGIALAMDVMLYDRHEELYCRAIAAAAAAGVGEFRVQDLGMAALIREQLPDAAITFAPTIGYANAAALDAAARDADLRALSLPIEMACADIESCCHTLASSETELLVQGPVLLQYSPRRMIAAATQGSMEGPALQRLAARDQNGRDCFFNESEHGLTMYAGSERSLLKKMATLATLPLTRWLFDCRQGVVPAVEYAAQAALRYRDEFHRWREAPAEWVPHDEHGQCLAELSGKKQQPGFFSANRTDKTDLAAIAAREARRDLGVVIDSLREKALTIDLYEEVKLGDLLEFHTPEGRLKRLRLERMTDLQGGELLAAAEGDIIRVPWIRAVVVSSKVRRAAEES